MGQAMLKHLLSLKDALADLFFPRICAFCGSKHMPLNCFICPGCYDSIRLVTSPACILCGSPIPGVHPAEFRTCGRCLVDPPPFDRVRFGVHYEGKLRDALVKFKYGGSLDAGRVLSAILVDAFQLHFQASEFDLILPVPIHPRRIRKRGFNQAVILAKQLSAVSGIPLYRNILRKVKDTPPQVGLGRKERSWNLKGSFGVSGPGVVKGRRVLLLDDVSTTGATIRETAKTVRKAGALRVSAFVLALRSDSSREDGSCQRGANSSNISEERQ
jgi:ComF family protein